MGALAGPCGQQPLTSRSRPGGTAFELDTPAGTARVHLDRPPDARGVLALGHGAGGGVDAPDLIAATDRAVALGWAVARIVQPYRVAGHRAPARAPRLDEAWLVAIAAVRRRRGLGSLPVVLGGRSSGARVACRTAATLDAVSVLALAFPMRPPGRPDVSRSDELAGAGVPVRVVQGERDPFGSAADIAMLQLPGVTVTAVTDADHALRTTDARVAIGEVVERIVQDAAT